MLFEDGVVIVGYYMVVQNSKNVKDKNLKCYFIIFVLFWKRIVVVLVKKKNFKKVQFNSSYQNNIMYFNNENLKKLLLCVNLFIFVQFLLVQLFVFLVSQFLGFQIGGFFLVKKVFYFVVIFVGMFKWVIVQVFISELLCCLGMLFFLRWVWIMSFRLFC